MKSLWTLLFCVSVAACSVPVGTPQKQVTTPVLQSSGPPTQLQKDAFAVAFLDTIQAQSIAERREFCGFLFVDTNGIVRASPPVRGTFAACNMPAPTRRSGAFASYHTHGAYGPQFDNEVPSVTDLESDFRLGLDGYVSTPGGRVWRVNHLSRDTVQLCGLGCVTSDPDFVPRNESGVFARYSLVQLALRTGI